MYVYFFIYLYYPTISNTAALANTLLHPIVKRLIPYLNLLVAFAKLHSIFTTKCRSAEFANKFTDLIFHFARLTIAGFMRAGCNIKFMDLLLWKLKNIF